MKNSIYYILFYCQNGLGENVDDCNSHGYMVKTNAADLPDIGHFSSYNNNILWAKGCDYPAVAFEKTTSVNYMLSALPIV